MDLSGYNLLSIDSITLGVAQDVDILQDGTGMVLIINLKSKFIEI